jgi:hypothetical protein
MTGDMSGVRTRQRKLHLYLPFNILKCNVLPISKTKMDSLVEKFLIE